MKSDRNGCSTCQNGQEQYEYFEVGGYPGSKKSERIQYDYRTPAGKLFSCVAVSLEAARAKRDTWIEKNDPADPLQVAADNLEAIAQRIHAIATMPAPVRATPKRDWRMGFTDAELERGDELCDEARGT